VVRGYRAKEDTVIEGGGIEGQTDFSEVKPEESVDYVDEERSVSASYHRYPISQKVSWWSGTWTHCTCDGRMSFSQLPSHTDSLAVAQETPRKEEGETEDDLPDVSLLQILRANGREWWLIALGVLGAVVMGPPSLPLLLYLVRYWRCSLGLQTRYWRPPISGQGSSLCWEQLQLLACLSRSALFRCERKCRLLNVSQHTVHHLQPSSCHIVYVAMLLTVSHNSNLCFAY